MAKKKKVRKKKMVAKKRVAKKRVAKRKAIRRRKTVRRKKLGRAVTAMELAAPVRKGLGPSAGGQSGDVEGLSETEQADSESVSELAEEGQDYEAEVVSGVENARDADQGEVKTHEVPEDDVPGEYLDKD
jgi:hypothetical protein